MSKIGTFNSVSLESQLTTKYVDSHQAVFIIYVASN